MRRPRGVECACIHRLRRVADVNDSQTRLTIGNVKVPRNDVKAECGARRIETSDRKDKGQVDETDNLNASRTVSNEGVVAEDFDHRRLARGVKTATEHGKVRIRNLEHVQALIAGCRVGEPPIRPDANRAALGIEVSFR